MGRSRKYPREIRERAVRMVLEIGERGAIARVASQLDINRETLRHWVRRAEVNQGLRDGITTEQREELKQLRKENFELRRANEILKSASAFFRTGTRPSPPEMTRYIAEHKGRFGVEPICRVLGANVSTYYAAKKRPPSPRALRDEELVVEIRRVHTENYGVYGARKVWRQLHREGIPVAKCTVERLMAREGIHGVRRGKRRGTTRRDLAAARPPDLVDRQFTASRPNHLWVADLTEIPTWSGICYAGFVIDAYSRMFVGWSVATHIRTELPLEALEMAIWRRDTVLDGLVHHSDAGSQYTSIRYTERLAEAGIAPSVGSVGDSYDNALAETQVGLYKTELIERHRPWRTPEEVELATLEYMDWFNNRRLHGSIGDVPPAEAEGRYYAGEETAELVETQ
ncbi:MAG: IS3 family transposase [Actinomycetota bacterium]